MPTIQNKTKRPLAVSLPGGKKLRLGPFQSGQVTHKALEHPPLKKLIDAGDIELAGDGKKQGEATSDSKPPTSARGGPGTGGIRYTGDR